MTAYSVSAAPKRETLIALAIALGVLLTIAAFWSTLGETISRWNRQEEYSHGYLIPVISLWLLWRRREALSASLGRPSWGGLVIVAFASVLHALGELSAIFFLAQIGFVLTLLGIVLAAGDYRLLKVAFLPIFFLFFAIPLPYFIDSVLSLRLQLLSSELAAIFIRAFGIPVYIDGNVIDLGIYKLQVVDACSGLRYLFPLLSLGFLAAYLFQAPLWKRAIVFLSTIPITIFMNSLRIALVGLLVNVWGPGMADGALHLFEGWVIFLACALVLVAEIYLLARFTMKKGLFEVFYVPRVATAPALSNESPYGRAPLAATLILLITGGTAAALIANRQEVYPERARFVGFPNAVGDWRGRTSSLEPQTEHYLGLDDYILADYAKHEGKAVNFYVAYYSSQRKGTSPHSPIVCIPGGGWTISQFDRMTSGAAAGLGFSYNRAVIERGNSKQIVYYWFEARGRKVANEWLAKWYLLLDAIAVNRTDAALVRVTTSLYPNESEADADARLLSMIPEFLPTLSSYLPASTVTTKRANIAPQRET